MTNTPENTRQSSSYQIALAAHDRGHRDHVVGIGRMAHPEEKSHGDDGEKTDHRWCSPCLDCCRRAQLIPAGGEEIQILFHAVAGFGGEPEDRHAWANCLEVTVCGMPVEFNRGC